MEATGLEPTTFGESETKWMVDALCRFLRSGLEARWSSCEVQDLTEESHGESDRLAGKTAHWYAPWSSFPTDRLRAGSALDRHFAIGIRAPRESGSSPVSTPFAHLWVRSRAARK